MLKSMTGFGKSSCEYNGKRITIEIRTLNSKQLDIYLKIPNFYKSKEFEIRSLASEHLLRGKMEVIVNVENIAANINCVFNKSIALQYYKELKNFSNEINQPDTDLLPVIIRLPEVLNNTNDELDSEEWNIVSKFLIETFNKVNDFREREGSVLQLDIQKRINLILDFLNQISSFENLRKDIISTKLKNNLNLLPEKIQFDQNRFEQELIYYLEKFDFTEEKVRLKKHLDYFIETINSVDSGRKLSFITQEISREINTLGAKAFDFNIQKIVVQMKDELEKIREQLFNII